MIMNCPKCGRQLEEGELLTGDGCMYCARARKNTDNNQLHPVPVGEEVFEEFGAEGVCDGVAEGGWQAVHNAGKNECPEEGYGQEDVGDKEGAVSSSLVGGDATDERSDGTRNKDDTVDSINGIDTNITDYHGETKPDQTGMESSEKDSL